MHVHRVHTCPACGRSIGDPRQDPDVMWLEDHLYYDHDAEDFPP